MKLFYIFSAMLLVPTLVSGEILVTQTPVSGGGVGRSSQLWQDPSGQNDLDSDAVCWEDFTIDSTRTITHIEWWGNGASELGFQIEVWRQDPNTIAYQPLGLFYYGGDHSVVPEAFFSVSPSEYTITPGPGGISHFSLDLTNPVTLAANDASNPRWFIGIVGLTAQPFATWNWSQGLGGSTRSFQFLRADGHTFRALPEGRAMVLADAVVPGGVVTPDSFMVTRGTYISGGVAELSDSDNVDLSIQRLGTDIQSRTEFTVKSTSPLAVPTSFDVTLEGSVFARSNVNQSIELFNYDSGNWELVDARIATRFTDSTVTVAVTGNLTRFVEANTMCIEAKVRFQSDNPRQNFASNTDLFSWSIH